MKKLLCRSSTCPTLLVLPCLPLPSVPCAAYPSAPCPALPLPALLAEKGFLSTAIHTTNNGQKNPKLTFPRTIVFVKKKWQQSLGHKKFIQPTFNFDSAQSFKFERVDLKKLSNLRFSRVVFEKTKHLKI